jgi:hypothetical protein
VTLLVCSFFAKRHSSALQFLRMSVDKEQRVRNAVLLLYPFKNSRLHDRIEKQDCRNESLSIRHQRGTRKLSLPMMISSEWVH